MLCGKARNWGEDPDIAQGCRGGRVGQGSRCLCCSCCLLCLSRSSRSSRLGSGSGCGCRLILRGGFFGTLCGGGGPLRP